MLSEVKTLGLFYWSIDLSWFGFWTLKHNSAGCWTRTSDHTNSKLALLHAELSADLCDALTGTFIFLFSAIELQNGRLPIVGFDPATLGFKVSSASPWATATAACDWSPGEFIFLFLASFFKMQLWPLWDLNQQPWDSKSVVLHPELSADS